jgi:hypothetical protein
VATERSGREGAVVVAYVHDNRNLTHSWHKSMMELRDYDDAMHGRVKAGGYIAMRFGTDGLTQARNEAVRAFLEQDNADWLFWVDTDMGFLPDTIDRLMDAAHPTDRPIVGALCFSLRETDHDGMGGFRTLVTPTVMDWAKVNGQMGWTVRQDIPDNTVTRVGGTGAACILMHRSAFEQIEKAHGRVWYDRVPNTTTGQLIGEDLSFCLRAGALNIPIHVHTGVPTTHFKSFWLGEEDYWRQVALRSAAEVLTENPAGTDILGS